MNEKITSEIEPLSSKRYARLISLKNKLKSGHDVSVRDLKNALTEDEWLRYEKNRASEMENRKIVLPVEIKEYSRRKKLADLAKARQERYHLRHSLGKKEYVIKNMTWRYEKQIGSVQEYFKEFIQSNGSLTVWLKTEHPYLSVNEAIEAGVLPILATSKSQFGTKWTLQRKFTIRELKEITINEAIDTFHDSEVAQQLPTIDKKKRDFSGFKF